MPTTTAPTVTREQAAAVLANPRAVVLLDLATGATTLETNPADDVWASSRVLVLVTHADAVAAAAEAAGHRDFLGRLTRILVLDLHALAAAGEIPTAEEVEAVLAELTHYEAEVIDLAARRGVA